MTTDIYKSKRLSLRLMRQRLVSHECESGLNGNLNWWWKQEVAKTLRRKESKIIRLTFRPRMSESGERTTHREDFANDEEAMEKLPSMCDRAAVEIAKAARWALYGEEVPSLRNLAAVTAWRTTGRWRNRSVGMMAKDPTNAAKWKQEWEYHKRRVVCGYTDDVIGWR